MLFSNRVFFWLRDTSYPMMPSNILMRGLSGARSNVPKVTGSLVFASCNARVGALHPKITKLGQKGQVLDFW